VDDRAARPATGADFSQQFQNLRLHRDVEGGGWFIGDNKQRTLPKATINAHIGNHVSNFLLALAWWLWYKNRLSRA